MSHTSSAGSQKLRHWLWELTTFCKRQFGEDVSAETDPGGFQHLCEFPLPEFSV